MQNEFVLEEGKVTLELFYSSKSFTKREILSVKTWSKRLLKAWNIFLSSNDIKKIKKYDFVISATLCGDSKMKRLNMLHRNKRRTTDVLSFPMQENLRMGNFTTFANKLNLGDIVISKDVCRKQAIDFGLSFEEELVHLLTHGFLHLCGFDHEISSKEEKLMNKFEMKIINLIEK